MALIGANELKKKLLIEVDGQPYNVLDVFFATPTARGASTMVRTRMKNLLNGAVLEKSFKTSEKFAEPDVEIATVSFLYSDPRDFTSWIRPPTSSSRCRKTMWATTAGISRKA